MQTTAPDLTQENVGQAIQAILEMLGDPESDLHRDALDAFDAGDAVRVKRLSATNLSDSYLRTLGYLVSAKKNPVNPAIDTLLAESARAAADHVKDKALNYLSAAIGNALN